MGNDAGGGSAFELRASSDLNVACGRSLATTLAAMSWIAGAVTAFTASSVSTLGSGLVVFGHLSTGSADRGSSIELTSVAVAWAAPAASLGEIRVGGPLRSALAAPRFLPAGAASASFEPGLPRSAKVSAPSVEASTARVAGRRTPAPLIECSATGTAGRSIGGATGSILGTGSSSSLPAMALASSRMARLTVRLDSDARA